MLPLSNREWSVEQKDVWQHVKMYTSSIMKGDVEGFLKYFHKNFLGWNYNQLLPVDKATIKDELLHLQKREIASYNITPVAINIFNDVAIVHYYYSVAYKEIDGKKKAKKGRNTDILLKQKVKWVLIGDHVGFLGNKK